MQCRSRQTSARAYAVIGLMLSFAIIAPRAVVADAASPIKLIAFGDSLTAGYQLKPESSFPARLQVAR